MLNAIKIPGFFITATDTGVGKTVIAAAIAHWFSDRGFNVGVCKIAATGCEWQRGSLVSEDAEVLSAAAGNRFALETICPIRYAEPLAPAVAAQRSGVPLNWSLLQDSLNTMVSQCDVLIVEGVGGVMVPMDDRHLLLDVAKWLELPTVVVARPGLGTINHTLLTVNALRDQGIAVAGVVINRRPQRPDVAEQTSAQAIEQWGRVPVLCQVPDIEIKSHRLPEEVLAATDPVDWQKHLRANQARDLCL